MSWELVLQIVVLITWVWCLTVLTINMFKENDG